MDLLNLPSVCKFDSYAVRYYAKAFKKDLAQAIDILSDILIHSKFDPGAIEEERHVILREMEEVEKSFEEVVFDRLHMTAFRNSPLGFTILGPPENIKTITRDNILDYIHDNYTTERLVRLQLGQPNYWDNPIIGTILLGEDRFLYN